MGLGVSHDDDGEDEDDGGDEGEEDDGGVPMRGVLTACRVCLSSAYNDFLDASLSFVQGHW